VAYPFSKLVRYLRPYAEYLYDEAVRAGWQPHVTSVWRSRTSQRKLYSAYLAGRTPYPVAPPGQSAHEHGWAFDMVLAAPGAQQLAGALWEKLGGTWGGKVDPVHFELKGATASLRGPLPNPKAGKAPLRPDKTIPKAPSRPDAPTPLPLAAEIADVALGFLPGVGAIELGASIVNAVSPSPVADFLSGPVEYVERLRFRDKN
jgi:hypothetical protein